MPAYTVISEYGIWNARHKGKPNMAYIVKMHDRPSKS